MNDLYKNFDIPEGLTGKINFQVNGFNTFPLSAITILQSALKAVADWNKVESFKL